MTVSLVARRHGVAPNQLFTWRRLVAQGSLTAAGSGEEVVPASDYRALQSQVRELLQGMKYYGCHLGPFPAPAREDDARIGGNASYCADEDLIRQRQAGKAWTWTALRPHSV